MDQRWSRAAPRDSGSRPPPNWSRGAPGRPGRPSRRSGRRGGSELSGHARSSSSANMLDERAFKAALDAAEQLGPLRAVVHCAGRGGDRLRILDKEGKPGDFESFSEIIRINLLGTYNVLRLSSARMAANEPLDGDRGRHRADGISRGLRRADRPDGLHRIEGGSSRDHPGRGPRPGEPADPCQHHRARHVRHPHAGAAPRRPA